MPLLSSKDVILTLWCRACDCSTTTREVNVTDDEQSTTITT
ncbi:unnamed protein product, partial [Rotaria sp. Silwood2]